MPVQTLHRSQTIPTELRSSVVTGEVGDQATRHTQDILYYLNYQKQLITTDDVMHCTYSSMNCGFASHIMRVAKSLLNIHRTLQ